MPTIYTIGHSNKPIEQFIELLANAGVKTLVDVRSKPASRWSPQFNRANMAHELPLAEIKYEWRGNNLGGFGGNVFQDESLNELTERVFAGESIAVCCSEQSHKDCHRKSMLEPEFTRRGLDVEHLQWKGLSPVIVKATALPDAPDTEPLF